MSLKKSYQDWHNHPKHSHAHWSSFIAISILVSLFIINQINLTYNPEYSFTVDKTEAASLTSAVLTPSDFVYQGYYDVQTYGNDTSYMAYLTHRYVNGELRFLTMTHRGVIHEFKIVDKSFGEKITVLTNQWDLSSTGALRDFQGIWFNSETNRLWVTSSADYTVYYNNAHITMMTLGNSGSITNVKKVDLTGIPEKRMYGGCQRVPSYFRTQLGGEYVCGWGGYTSLVAQAGGASIGPTMYAIPDPELVSNGGSVTPRVLLDTVTSRGERKTIPINYFDGGDSRQNPPSRPTDPPLATADWLSPNSNGNGWMVWGDSYYNTGMWIETASKQGFVSIASLGKGYTWYCSSTLCYDDRQYEMHIWNPNRLDDGILTRPDSMTELVVPRRDGTCLWIGNVPSCNISGATYDSVSGKVYMIGFPLGPDVYTGRMYVYDVNGGGGASVPPTPTVTPVDAVVSGWSSWSAITGWSTCANNSQTRTEQRTRTIITPASNGGSTPALSETQTVSQSCTVASVPTDATVSAWSGWSATTDWGTCLNGTQTRTEQRTRTVITPATNGGSTPALSETQTVSQSCTVDPVSTKNYIGQNVQTIANVNVRVTGGGTLLGTQSIGSTGKIVAGPTYSNSVTWWQIDYTSGVDGWSGDDYLIDYVLQTPTPVPVPIVGDINLDGIVNSLDWSIMNSKWFTEDSASDLNDDGIVNSIDFSILNNNWFKTTP